MNLARLAKQTGWAIFLCTILVLVCYFFIDAPVAFWVQANFTTEGKWIEPETDVVPYVVFGAPFVVGALLVWRYWREWRHWQLTVLAALVNLLAMSFAKDGLKWVFGRPWPSTWIRNNPSLINDGVYNFHWFHGGLIFGSFPSGHTTATAAIASILWIAYPKLRWLAVLAVVTMVVALVGNNYHFVGDCVAGGFLGSIGGAWTAWLLGLTSRSRFKDLAPGSTGEYCEVEAARLRDPPVEPGATSAGK
jgi:membrane-associated phospholipid phosphatase